MSIFKKRPSSPANLAARGTTAGAGAAAAEYAAAEYAEPLADYVELLGLLEQGLSLKVLNDAEGMLSFAKVGEQVIEKELAQRLFREDRLEMTGYQQSFRMYHLKQKQHYPHQPPPPPPFQTGD